MTLRTFPSLSLTLAAMVLCAAGCAVTPPQTWTPRQAWESLKGEGFPGWSADSGLRGGKDPKASGFFTDRRSEQIEKDLGGF